ncbi:4'-phosphopantetheinyl transferase family protein [Streptomyces showdoensis]|uniref:4'-phosphopantetheinyl transferase n=1 Tax=Streptomyces showdoensis TaxID=68268 RepID=A0A2P2GGD1_STREW|nr:4'-phosphopantetheinyl transferase superfamily protein [Streptomyces showdoensis]KKZ70568.1 4'-phosphopantetheinyl transferase [Streptomyces showdoensis]
MIEELLPRPVATAEAFGDPAGAPVPFPGEEHLLARAVPARRREFTTARTCARRALGGLGLPPVAIPYAEPSRAPRWPDGIVGSITHCAGYRAAAVARDTDLVALGFDAEPHAALDNTGVLHLVTGAEERAHLAELAALRPEIHWDRALFSAKESVFKAWSPLTGRWLDFSEATVVFRPDDSTFTARLLVEGPVVDGVRLTGFEGGFLVRDGLVLTATTVRRPDNGPDPHHRSRGQL